jgi:hypothetical protein
MVVVAQMLDPVAIPMAIVDDGEPAFRSALVFAVCDVCDADDVVEHNLLHQLVVKNAQSLLIDQVEGEVAGSFHEVIARIHSS